jgi:hypothetical protein
MRPVVIVGIGELSSVFARGLLRVGHPVFPVTRRSRPEEVLARAEDAELVLVAVGERDLGPVLDEVPKAFRDRVALLQNELLPRDWRAHGLTDPTVAVVWFETTNLAGIRTRGTVGELVRDHRALYERVAAEVLDVQAARIGADLPRKELMLALDLAIAADPNHPCTGRSAPERLLRVLAQAREAGLETPELSRIAASLPP